LAALIGKFGGGEIAQVSHLGEPGADVVVNIARDAGALLLDRVSLFHPREAAAHGQR
jgi:hypothetical protein